MGAENGPPLSPQDGGPHTYSSTLPPVLYSSLFSWRDAILARLGSLSPPLARTM
jgi:hypothetical protein